MEWWVTLTMLFCLLLAILATGMPVAFAFMVTNFVGIIIFAGWGQLDMLVRNGVDLISSGSLLPVTTFTMMGMILSHSGLGKEIIDAIDKWLGRLPGRLSLLAVVAGTIIGALSGVSMAVSSILCTTVAPTMMEKGYSKDMTIGPVMVGALIDTLIPPSTIVVVYGVIAQVSIGKLLIAIIMPGILLASLCMIYIIIRAIMRPEVAPRYEVHVTTREKIAGLQFVLPVGFIFMMALGLIFLGVATPNEASALGALGCFIVVAIYRRLTWDVCKKTILDGVRVSVMVFFICMTASVYSNLLSYSGAVAGASAAIVQANMSKTVILFLMIFIVLILGMFTEGFSIMLMTVPVFMPFVRLYGVDPLWFSVLYLVAIVIGNITPPFGLILYVTQALLRGMGVTMRDVFKAAVPYVVIALISMLFLCAFPEIILWLPRLMKG